MNPTEYLKNVLITKSSDYDAIKCRIDPKMVDLLHAGLGWSSELSELVDATYVPNLDDIDYVNIAEEIGDVSWYCSIAIDALGLDPESVSLYEKDAKWGNLREKDYEHLRVTTAAIVWASGEFNDLVKKSLFYGREFDLKKAERHLKSLSMAMAGAAVVCGTTMEKIRETNIAKLKARFAEKFTNAEALNRNLEVERKILEDGVK